MKHIELQSGPGVTPYILAVLAVFALCTNLGWCADINDDINSYRAGIFEIPASSSTTYPGSYSSYNDNARFGADSTLNAQQHQRFMDNEYGSQTPNPSCYLCNGY